MVHSGLIPRIVEPQSPSRSSPVQDPTHCAFFSRQGPRGDGHLPAAAANPETETAPKPLGQPSIPIPFSGAIHPDFPPVSSPYCVSDYSLLVSARDRPKKSAFRILGEDGREMLRTLTIFHIRAKKISA
jgi:hypothetical protein